MRSIRFDKMAISSFSRTGLFWHRFSCFLALFRRKALLQAMTKRAFDRHKKYKKGERGVSFYGLEANLLPLYNINHGGAYVAVPKHL